MTSRARRCVCYVPVDEVVDFVAGDTHLRSRTRARIL
jgi:hypothetical protein